MPPTRGSKAEMKTILDVSFCSTIQKKIDASSRLAPSRSASSYVSTVGTLAIPVCKLNTGIVIIGDRASSCSTGHHADLERTMQRP